MIEKEFENWCVENKLLQTVNENIVTFEGLEDKFLLVSHKEKLLTLNEDEKLCLVLNQKEKDSASKVNGFIFFFGKKFYYSKSDSPVKLKPLKYLGKSYRPEDLQEEHLTHLGIHSGFELLNGSRNLIDWIEKANFIQVRSLGICDYNTLSAALKFQIACEGKGIKPVIGETVRVKDSSDNYYDVKLYVKNPVGWRNLLEINTIINVDNFDKPTPYIEEEQLLKYSEYLICVISCHGKGIKEDYVKRLLKGKFSRVFYQFDTCEYKSNAVDSELLDTIQMFMKSKLVEPVLINDSYYLDEKDKNTKILLNKIDQGRALKQSDNQYFKDLDDSFFSIEGNFKEEDLINYMFKALDNANLISEECNFYIQTGINMLPKYVMTPEEEKKYKGDRRAMFFDKLEDGLNELIPKEKHEEYRKRLEVEIEVIEKVDSFEGNGIDYFLQLWDVCMYCEKNDILTGPGRGSSAGTLVAYLLKITKVDPIQYGLIFERFLTEGRIGSLSESVEYTFETEQGEVKLFEDEKVNICRNEKELYICVSEIKEGDKLLI